MGRRCKTALVLVMALMVVSALAIAGGAGSSEGMVGAEECGRCHQAALAAWQESAHQRAYVALSGKQASDPRCLQCHGRQGVQCESCHGVGQHYSAKYVMKDKVLSRLVGLVEMDQKVCLRCHTDSAPSLKPFDYDTMWSVVSHGKDQPKEKSPENK